MASVETKIFMALRQRVVSIPARLPLDWGDSNDASPTTPAGPSTYIEVRNNPNIVSRRFIGSTAPMDRPGILQLTLCYPVAKKHKVAAIRELAGQIAAHFPTDMRLPFDDIVVRIERAADVAEPYRDDAHWRCPISIRWRVWA